MRKLIATLMSVMLANVALAEEFLGEEAASSEEAAPETKASATKERPRRPANEDAAPSGSGDISISGGIGAGAGYVNGHATIGYGFSRYTAIDTTFGYARYDSGKTAGEQYGPEVDFILRLPNPTIVTPFVGAGPGFLQWKRTYAEETFDHDNGWTANAFGGLNIKLTRHFGIQGVRKQTRWLTPPPRTFSDHETREPKVAISNAIGFHVVW